ncbi:hypothetical protein I4U23_009852 [Adineta vaga]|nr:hypothetical protein I4U23_009852 [Adineta vaga]
MVTSTSKRVVIETSLYYNEEMVNYAAINPHDDMFSQAKQVEVFTKYGVVKFVVIINPSVTIGAIALNRFQRKKYHMKMYRSYVVRSYSPASPTRTFFEIINEKFNLNDKIGGMQKVLEEIFGNVLLPRLYPQSFIAKTDINKTRARTVCDALNVIPKVIRGPEILSCMLGESEKNIRDLFEDARSDQQSYGSNSRLHVIIFDEMDAIGKNRTGSNSVRDTVHDSITAQLLAEIDGMAYLNNILIIGTTNILEAIDPALLRPGRIETVIKVDLPDARARSAIFDLHMKALLRNGALYRDVDVNSIIHGTEGLTGAHIERIIRLAIHAAMRRDILHRNTFDVTDEQAEELQVRNDDFIETLTKVQQDQSTCQNNEQP